ncbi:hypothetical protein [Brachybacterium alimentarium]|uniref:hypothetical protein n=1 Tax=Brachybacterium alimentarium TaxID=47845 RepID=UPI000DF3C99F|nr:hypothetical protein [Brachybacterium alimentarium]RCS78887.1 hypothetical protein CIK72_10975 [Brachybacterium alimentarium]
MTLFSTAQNHDSRSAQERARVGRRRALTVGAAGLGALAIPAAAGLPAARAEHTGAERQGAESADHGGHGPGESGGDHGPNFPDFTYAGVITEGLSYDPTGEFIFPSVLHAGRHLRDPLGEWYLYYAPHENPGGICLMYADSLDGPWTEYVANPLIENEWGDFYSAPHVSSPHVFWNEGEQKLFCYFHGPNSVTRFATSHDGVRFEYGDVAVTTDMLGDDSTEASYARIFEHPDRHSHCRYGMFFMENTTADHRRIRVAQSVDGRDWDVLPEPLVTPGELDDGNVSGADLWTWRGRTYVIYHASSGIVFARPVDRTLTSVGKPQVLHQASGEGEDTGRVAAPQVVTLRGRSYLFYERGARLDGAIAYAVSE